MSMDQSLAESKRILSLPSGSSIHTFLNLSFSSNNDAIRASYRRLARLLHPDKTNNDPGCAEAFKRLQSALAAVQTDSRGQGQASTSYAANAGGDIWAQLFQESRAPPAAPSHPDANQASKPPVISDQHRAVWGKRTARPAVATAPVSTAAVKDPPPPYNTTGAPLHRSSIFDFDGWDQPTSYMPPNHTRPADPQVLPPCSYAAPINPHASAWVSRPAAPPSSAPPPAPSSLWSGPAIKPAAASHWRLPSGTTHTAAAPVLDVDLGPCTDAVGAALSPEDGVEVGGGGSGTRRRKRSRDATPPGEGEEEGEEDPIEPTSSGEEEDAIEGSEEDEEEEDEERLIPLRGLVRRRRAQVIEDSESEEEEEEAGDGPPAPHDPSEEIENVPTQSQPQAAHAPKDRKALEDDDAIEVLSQDGPPPGSRAPSSWGGQGKGAKGRRLHQTKLQPVKLTVPPSMIYHPPPPAKKQAVNVREEVPSGGAGRRAQEYGSGEQAAALGHADDLLSMLEQQDEFELRSTTLAIGKVATKQRKSAIVRAVMLKGGKKRSR